MTAYTEPASRASIDKAAAALEANGFRAVVAKDRAAAREAVLGLIPKGAEVFTMSSVTLEETGLAEVLNGPDYDSVRERFKAMDPARHAKEMRARGSAPDWSLGSVHALTEGGSLVIASLTGSQLPAQVYGAGNVVLVVGAQKIVKDLDAAMERLERHVVPLESVRAREAYGLPEGFKTFPSKILTWNRETTPDRATVVIVEESLGF
ncbi:MAG TPA: LUD domain-containing protein [Spirochaetales bacterium]|nr:LUD domain-containing protein [Spirochaetales bacterium]